MKKYIKFKVEFVKNDRHQKNTLNKHWKKINLKGKIERSLPLQ